MLTHSDFQVAPVLLHSLSVEGGLIATSTSGDITLQKVVAHGISLTSEEGTLELVHTTSGVEVCPTLRRLDALLNLFSLGLQLHLPRLYLVH